MRIVNVSNSTSPYEVGFYDTYAVPQSVLYLESYVFMADSSRGLIILRILYPSSPQLVEYYNTPDTTMDVYVLDYYVYVANYKGGVQIYEYYHPTKIKKVNFNRYIKFLIKVKNPVFENNEFFLFSDFPSGGI